MGSELFCTDPAGLIGTGPLCSKIVNKNVSIEINRLQKTAGSNEDIGYEPSKLIEIAYTIKRGFKTDLVKKLSSIGVRSLEYQTGNTLRFSLVFDEQACNVYDEGKK